MKLLWVELVSKKEITNFWNFEIFNKESELGEFSTHRAQTKETGWNSGFVWMDGRSGTKRTVKGKNYFEQQKQGSCGKSWLSTKPYSTN